MKVLLLRNPTQGGVDRYHESLESSGFYPHSIPVLETIWSDQARMKNILLTRSSDYTGVIVTSSRAAEAWKSAVEDLITTSSDVSWSDVTFYVVGSSTADALRSMPKSSFTPSEEKVLGSHTGSGEALARFIVEHLADPTAEKLLYLKGDKNRETLPEILNEHNVNWDGVQAYETRGSSGFKGDLEALVKSQPHFESSNWWIVFFAPSSADFVLPHLLKYFTFDSSSSSKPKVAAIGPTTSTHLFDKLHIRVDVISSKPSPDVLASDLRKYIDMK